MDFWNESAQRQRCYVCEACGLTICRVLMTDEHERWPELVDHYDQVLVQSHEYSCPGDRPRLYQEALAGRTR
jgi:hypothetical protein